MEAIPVQTKSKLENSSTTRRSKFIELIYEQRQEIYLRNWEWHNRMEIRKPRNTLEDEIERLS